MRYAGFMHMQPSVHPSFSAAIDSLHGKFERLLECEPLVFGELPVRMPKSGVYLFSEGGSHLYVGRSNRLRKRYFLHCRPGSRQNQASFAFKLAKEEVAQSAPQLILIVQSRATLAATPVFATAFASAKERIRRMAYRYVEEDDQTRQALLEAYCVIALATKHNDFDTH